MLTEKVPENAIFLKLGYLEVSAFGQMAILAVFVLAIFGTHFEADAPLLDLSSNRR